MTPQYEVRRAKKHWNVVEVFDGAESVRIVCCTKGEARHAADELRRANRLGLIQRDTGREMEIIGEIETHLIRARGQLVVVGSKQ